MPGEHEKLTKYCLKKTEGKRNSSDIEVDRSIILQERQSMYQLTLSHFHGITFSIEKQKKSSLCIFGVLLSVKNILITDCFAMDRRQCSLFNAALHVRANNKKHA
jgi:hypothetical protein